MEKNLSQENREDIPERKNRISKRQELMAKGINPYVFSYKRSYYAKDLHEQEEVFITEEKTVSVCGKVQSRRIHGGSLFLDVADVTGKIQLYAKSDLLGLDQFNLLKDYVDIGDFIGAKGNVFRTTKGELSIRIENFELLTKAIMPVPATWYGLKDTEKRFRQRYLDLLLNAEVKERFLNRAKIIDAIRNCLKGDGFLEIDTPVLHPIYGGANAKPFKTYYESLKKNFYLRISNELYLKRALIGNFEKVFEFSRDFRNEGIDATHNPEFTMIEIYEAYKDYRDFMALTQQLILRANVATGKGTTIEWNGKKIDLSGEWPIIPMRHLLKKHTGLDIMDVSREALFDYSKKTGFDVSENAVWGALVDIIFSEKVQPELVNPTFVIDYPLDISPLAKQHRKENGLVERFELYIGCKEIANGFSELNDPIEQKKRFEHQQKNRLEGDVEAHPMDEDFLLAMEYGMPPAAGVGIGIDRLAMLLTDAQNIREVIMFPQLRDNN